MINFHRRPGKYFWDAAQLSQRLTNFSADYSFVFAKYLSILLERENLQTLCPCSCHDSKSLEGEGQGVETLQGGVEAFYWRAEDQRSRKTTKQWSRAESKLYGTLCTREFRVVALSGRKAGEKVRRLGRATCKACKRKG